MRSVNAASSHAVLLRQRAIVLALLQREVLTGRITPDHVTPIRRTGESRGGRQFLAPLAERVAAHD